MRMARSHTDVNDRTSLNNTPTRIFPTRLIVALTLAAQYDNCNT